MILHLIFLNQQQEGQVNKLLMTIKEVSFIKQKNANKVVLRYDEVGQNFREVFKFM